MTALMQASSASIAIVLTALNGEMITFEIGAAMVIGANVGTTITVLLGSIGGTQAKKRVAMSHLVFNVHDRRGCLFQHSMAWSGS